MKFKVEALAKLDADVAVPFTVDVLIDPQTVGDACAPLEFTDVARVLRGRRLSGTAVWQGKPVFAKVFLGPRARRYWQRHNPRCSECAGSSDHGCRA